MDKPSNQSDMCTFELPFAELCTILKIVQNSKPPKGCDMIGYSAIIFILTSAIQSHIESITLSE